MGTSRLVCVRTTPATGAHLAVVVLEVVAPAIDVDEHARERRREDGGAVLVQVAVQIAHERIGEAIGERLEPWLAIVVAPCPLLGSVRVLLSCWPRASCRTVVVFLRLAFGSDLYALWTDVLWTAYVTVYVVSAVAMFAAAYLIRLDVPVLQRIFSVAGLFELWFLINIVIANCFHSANGALNFDFATSRPAEKHGTRSPGR